MEINLEFMDAFKALEVQERAYQKALDELVQEINQISKLINNIVGENQ